MECNKKLMINIKKLVDSKYLSLCYEASDDPKESVQNFYDFSKNSPQIGEIPL